MNKIKTEDEIRQEKIHLIKIKNKTVDIFFKNMTTDEFMNILDKEYPVGTEYLEDLVERVWYRYPLVSKAEIAIVVKGFFGALRYALISNKIITCDNLLHYIRFRLRRKFRHEGTRRKVEVPFFIVSKILIKMDKGIKKYARS